jgi:hypothetical protein
MDTIHIWVLIRTLFFLGLIGVLMIEVVFFAPRDKHRSSSRLGDQLTDSGEQQGKVQRSLPYPPNRGHVEANDPEASPAGVQRRAA